MNVEMYSRIGNKALPDDNRTTVKVINFVDDKGNPVTFGHGSAGSAGPAGPAGSADPAGQADTITKARHVDPETGTLEQVVNALIDAGLME